jgi:hypothetical protein
MVSVQPIKNKRITVKIILVSQFNNPRPSQWILWDCRPGVSPSSSSSFRTCPSPPGPQVVFLPVCELSNRARHRETHRLCSSIQRGRREGWWWRKGIAFHYVHPRWRGRRGVVETVSIPTAAQTERETERERERDRDRDRDRDKRHTEPSLHQYLGVCKSTKSEPALSTDAVCVSSYHYVCVRTPLYVCPHTTIYVSSYYYLLYSMLSLCVRKPPSRINAFVYLFLYLLIVVSMRSYTCSYTCLCVHIPQVVSMRSYTCSYTCLCVHIPLSRINFYVWRLMISSHLFVTLLSISASLYIYLSLALHLLLAASLLCVNNE